MAIWGRIAFQAFLAVVFTLAAFETREFNEVGTWFPLYSSVLGATLSVILVVVELLGLRRARAVLAASGVEGTAATRVLVAEGEPEGPPPLESFGDAARAFARSWFPMYLLFVLLTAVVGTWIATVLWLPATMVLRARSKILQAVVITAVWLAVVFLLNRFLDVRLPEGVLF